jgi:hypothetical protein
MRGKEKYVHVMTLKVLDMHMSYFSFICSYIFIWIHIFNYNILLDEYSHLFTILSVFFTTPSILFLLNVQFIERVHFRYILFRKTNE